MRSGGPPFFLSPSPLAASLAQSYSQLISIGELNSGAGKNFFDCLQALWITGVTANFNIVDRVAVKPGSLAKSRTVQFKAARAILICHLSQA